MKLLRHQMQDLDLDAPIILLDNVKFILGFVNFSAEVQRCFFRCLEVFKEAVSEGGDTRRC